MSDREVMGAMAATLRKQEAEIAELRATFAKREALLKMSQAREHGYAIQLDQIHKMLREREAEIEKLGKERTEMVFRWNGLKEGLQGREAEIERLKAELKTAWNNHALESERGNKYAAALAAARKEALEEAATFADNFKSTLNRLGGGLYEEDVRRNALAAKEIGRAIRALASDTKGEM